MEKKRIKKIVEFLENPNKRGDIPPEQLLQLIPIKIDDNILDLGAGSGYITIPAAKYVKGVVYALDINSTMLEIIKSKAKQENIGNLVTLEASIDNIPLENSTIDISLASFVLHEVMELSIALEKINQVLKKNGHFVCIEFEKNEPYEEPHPRISSTTMEQEILKAGFHVIEKIFPTKGVYIIIAKK
jgi:ubiquinone/menaquinone biosynthesis C-methylase UbiE